MGTRRSGLPCIVVATLAALMVPAPAAAFASAPGGGASLSLADRAADLARDGPTLLFFTFATPLGDAERAVLASHASRVEEFPFIEAALVLVDADGARAIGGSGLADGVFPDEPLAFNLASSRSVIRAAAALPLTGGGANATVVVVDSGIDATHPALEGRVRKAVAVDARGVHAGSGDSAGHGTHIAGIVGGNGARSVDGRHTGIAPRANLVAVDISDSFTTANAVRAFEWIHENRHELGIRVVQNSWGRDREDASYDPDDPVIRASNALVSDGLVVVFSAGNGGEGRGTLTVEAMNPNVLTVGATDDYGRVEPYSSRGPAVDARGQALPWVKPDVVAPGTLVTSARPAKGGAVGLSAVEDEAAYYFTLNGTSMAAPHVAGAVALMLDANPTLTVADVREIIATTAADHGPDGADAAYGYGVLDAEAAVRVARDGLPGERVEVRTRTDRTATQGSLVAVSGRIVLHDARVSEDEQVVEHAFPVREGARNISVSFAFHAEDGGFAVTLTDGARTFGPFPEGAPLADGTRVVRGFITEGVRPGAWKVVARPTGAATSADYRLVEEVGVEERVVVASDGGRITGRPVTFYGDGGFFAPQDSAFARVASGPMLALVGAAALAAASVLVVGALAAGGRRPPARLVAPAFGRPVPRAPPRW